MFVGTFVFFALFVAIYAVYTRKITQKQFTPWGYLVTAISSAVFCGIAVHAIGVFWQLSLGKVCFAMIVLLIFLLVELLYCLQLSDRLFGRYHHILQLVRLHHDGLLLKMPYHQGEELYWIDGSTPLPCVRKMYFVVAVSGCYIGIYQSNKQLVIVREVYVDAQTARQQLVYQDSDALPRKFYK